MIISLIEYPTETDWLKVKTRALVTQGLTPKTMPDLDWKRKMLKCRHSPIRKLPVSFFVEGLPYWVSNELCRHHVGVEKYIKSQRNDRQSDYDRNSARQDAPVNAIVDFNAESFLTFCNKRLCSKASKEMREMTQTMASLLIQKCPEFFGFCVPNCQWHGGVCYEPESCRNKDN